ncbi:MAG: NUDIX hydrolase [Candidatus Magasanikbacteria bacterium]
MPKHLKKISEETLHENPWCKYKHDTYEKPNGQVGDYFYLESEGSVMIVPVLSDGRIALVLQQRYLFEKQSIEFPAGKAKGNQTILEAAKAELQEETGYTADEMVNVGIFAYAPAQIKNYCNVYIAHVSKQGEQNLDDSEEIDVLYRRPDEIEEMIKNNEIFNGPTMAVWALVRNHFIK